MPSLVIKLYSLYFKLTKRYQLHNLLVASQFTSHNDDPFSTTSRSDDTTVTNNPTFDGGIATKDIHIDPFSCLNLRIFLPETAVNFILVCCLQNVFSSREVRRQKRLPVVLQFHGGGFMSGINDSAANDEFCRRIVRLCNVTVVAIGYRLAPESQYLTTFDDELKVLNWMNKQVDLVQLGDERFKGFDRCVLLRVSCCANIADYLARKAVEAGKLLDLVKVVIQVLMYPFFIGSILTKSEIKLANLYIYDKASYLLAPPEEECDLDPPAANPLILGREPPLKYWMRDPATAYSEELWKANVDASILDYKDAVHEFATLDFLLQTPKALAYADDIAI